MSAPTLLQRSRSVISSWWRGNEIVQGEPVLDDRVEWSRILPFIALHLAVLGVFWVGVSPIAVIVAFALYLVRMFAVTAFYHRYFSHRVFRTSRPFQFIMAVIGCTAGQRGPMWWAAQHRHHHKHSDDETDVHSPRHRGFLWSHMLWFTTRGAFQTPIKYVRDWWQYPELRLVERWNWIPTALLAVGTYALGSFLASAYPSLGTSALQLFVWGYVCSTIFLYHATYTINSLAHQFGRRRFATKDDSRNNLWLALLTLGEGWHNNHHHFPTSARQGFYWWEVDLSYYGLVLLSWTGLIWDLRPVPAPVLERRRIEAP